MFQRIIVPLDGSDRAESVLPLAACIARASGGTIILVRVVAISTDAEVFLAQPTGAPESVTKIVVDEARDYLVHITGSEALAGIATEIEVMAGEAAASILAVTESSQADLVVLCSHGYSGPKRWALGSVADKVIRHTSEPVLLLRETGPVIPPSQPGHTFHALVSLDGSRFSAAALLPAAHLAAALAAPLQGSLHLLHVIEVPATDGRWKNHASAGAQLVERQEDARAYLATMMKRLENELGSDVQIAITASVVTGSDVAEGILRAGESGEDSDGKVGSGPYDLIAMATHGRNGLPRLMLGSVTERVIHRITLPMLIVHPKHGIETKEPEHEVADTPSWPVLF
jgi:nucleotide-binding universal stress UspA family protein